MSETIRIDTADLRRIIDHRGPATHSDVTAAYSYMLGEIERYRGMECPAADAQDDANGSGSGQSESQQGSLPSLISAIQAQTEALARLAESNEALTCALFGQRQTDDEGDSDQQSTHYLDGSGAI